MNSNRSLGSIFAALNAQRILVAIILVAGLLAAGLAVWLIPPKYSATSTILMVAEPPEAQNHQVPTTATKPLLSSDLPSLATSATVLARFKSDIGAKEDLDQLRGRIRAKVVQDSNIMPVQYMARTEGAAITGANALADEISHSYRELATSRFDSLIRDLNAQISGRRSQLMRLDSRLQTAAQTYPYIDVGSPQGATGTQSSVYERMIALRAVGDELRATVQSDAAIASSSASFVNDAKPIAMRDVVENDTVYRNLHEQYAKDLAQLKHLEAFATETYPGLVELRGTVAREAAQVAVARQHAETTGPGGNSAYAQALDAQAKDEGQLAGDQAKLDAVDKELTALNADVGQGGIAANVALIRRDRENVELTYSTLSERLAKAVADRAEASSTGSVIVMDHAQYAQPATWTSGVVIGSALLVFAIWLAITVGLSLGGSRERFRDPAPVERIYGAPVLGEVA